VKVKISSFDAKAKAAEVELNDEAPGSLLGRLLTSLGSASVEFTAPPEVSA